MSTARRQPSKRHVFTSESVTEGHPDKVADQVSDAILDEMLLQDPRSRVACETLLTTGVAVVAGEITTNAYVEIPDVVRAVVKRIGYTDAAYGFDFRTCAVMTAIGRQSADIALGVDPTGSRDQGAGDQGMMFGYASAETPELMPLPIVLAHRLAEQLAAVRKGANGAEPLPWLRPDGKTQVSVAYEGDRPVALTTVVVSTQHDEMAHGRALAHADITAAVTERVIAPVLARYELEPPARIWVNPTGRFVIGGPQGDAGLTGRKIIVDTYGGMARHGGGAFSGKDPSKVDRSAAYAARWVAKTLVEAKLATRAEVQVAYAIGVAEPVSVMVDTFGTGVVPDERLEVAVREVFDLRPAAIIEALGLLKPIYGPTAAYGHFGRAPERTTVGSLLGNGRTVEAERFSWERTDRAGALRTAAGG
jgi:S-adenosylmethionine synthetase